MVKPVKGRTRRAARLAQLGAGLVGSYLGYQLQRPFLNEEQRENRRRDLRRKSAKEVREQLQDLRGPIMKVGQALSIPGADRGVTTAALTAKSF